jgi:hypothetical protein
MPKYKLINSQTGEEHLCDKVTIDEFDYYVSDNPNINDVIVYNNTIGKLVFTQDDLGQGYDIEIGEGVSYPILEPLNIVKKVIATSNPSLGIPQVVDEVERLTFQEFKDWSFGEHGPWHTYKMFQKGYNKSQETHSNSDEDMLEFVEWLYTDCCADSPFGYSYKNKYYTPKELLQIWKEQRPKKVYYVD